MKTPNPVSLTVGTVYEARKNIFDVEMFCFDLQNRRVK